MKDLEGTRFCSFRGLPAFHWHLLYRCQKFCIHVVSGCESYDEAQGPALDSYKTTGYNMKTQKEIDLPLKPRLAIY